MMDGKLIWYLLEQPYTRGTDISLFGGCSTTFAVKPCFLSHSQEP